MEKTHYTNIYVLYTFYAVLLVGSTCKLPDLSLIPLSTSTANSGDQFIPYITNDYFPRLTSVVDIKSTNQKLFLVSHNSADATINNGLRLYRNDGRLVGKTRTISRAGSSYYSNTNSRLIVNTWHTSLEYNHTLINTIQTNQGVYTFSNEIMYGSGKSNKVFMTLGGEESTFMISIATLYLWRTEIIGNTIVESKITQLPSVKAHFTDASIYKSDFILVGVTIGRLFFNSKSDFSLLQTGFYDHFIDFFLLDTNNNDIAFITPTPVSSKRLNKYNIASMFRRFWIIS